jgi:hypothetical protein
MQPTIKSMERTTIYLDKHTKLRLRLLAPQVMKSKGTTDITDDDIVKHLLDNKVILGTSH